MNTKILSYFCLVFLMMGIWSCYTPQQLSNAKNYITDLKENALLVRLSNAQKQIKHLEKLGYQQKANQIRAERIKENKEIISTFRQHFDFCPVYFFGANDSRKIKDNQFDKVFVNDSLELDESIKANFKNFYVAEFGFVQQDTAKYYDHTNSDQVDKYYGGSTPQFQGLIVKSNEFVQLSKPFPYYIKENRAVLQSSKVEMVQKLNAKLHDFYEKHGN